MNLIDNFNINDNLGLNGYVIIRDKFGKILVEKHNMILKAAKEKFMNVFFGAGTLPNITPENNDLSNFLLNRIEFYEIGDEVSYREEIIEENLRVGLSFRKNSRGDNFIDNTIDDDDTPEFTYNSSFDGNLTYGLENLGDGHYRLNVSVSLSLSGDADSSEKIVINSLALIMEKTTLNEGETYSRKTHLKPFSRIKFDPIILTQESSLNLTYYVYF